MLFLSWRQNNSSTPGHEDKAEERNLPYLWKDSCLFLTQWVQQLHEIIKPGTGGREKARSWRRYRRHLAVAAWPVAVGQPVGRRRNKSGDKASGAAKAWHGHEHRSQALSSLCWTHEDWQLWWSKRANDLWTRTPWASPALLWGQQHSQTLQKRPFLYLLLCW